MKFADRVKETTSVTSTALVVLAGASTGYRSVIAAFAAGTTDICLEVADAAGNWEVDLFTLVDATHLTRTSILSSSNGGAAVTFPAGSKDVYCTVPASYLAGGSVLDLAAAVSAASTDYVMITKADATGSYRVPVSAISSGTSTPSTPGDTTAPQFATGAALTSSSVTQTGFVLTWPAATDAVGVARYEYTVNGGGAWTTAGTSLAATVTTAQAGTTYSCAVRAVDAAGNVSAQLSASVTTTAAPANNSAPAMSGSLTASSPTATGYVLTWTAGTDADGNLAGYDYSTDGGATWIQLGNVLTVTVSNAAAATTYGPRVRARDTAGALSNVLSTSVTTSAAPQQTMTVTSPAAGSTQTVGTAYTASGTYANGTPTALDFSVDGGTTWTAAPSPTISGGNWSFTATPSTTSTGRTMMVRDHTTLVSGTSGTYTVAAAAATTASQFTVKANTFNVGPTTMAGSAPNQTSNQNVRVEVRPITAGAALVPTANMKMIWGKKGFPPPLGFNDGGTIPANSNNGNTVVSSVTVTSTVSGLSDYTNSGSAYYGLYQNNGTFNVYGSAGTYNLFVLFSDGSYKAAVDSNGVAAEWTLQ